MSFAVYGKCSLTAIQSIQVFLAATGPNFSQLSGPSSDWLNWLERKRRGRRPENGVFHSKVFVPFTAYYVSMICHYTVYNVLCKKEERKRFQPYLGKHSLESLLPEGGI